MPDDRATLEQVASMYREYAVLMQAQRDTLAKMLRACEARLKSPDSRKRAEAIKAIADLADMLEKES